MEFNICKSKYILTIVNKFNWYLKKLILVANYILKNAQKNGLGYN